MSISWGKSERYKFTPGGTFIGWTPPMVPAVYAITYKQDSQNKPNSHTVLYFGEAADLSQEAPSLNAKVLETWRDTGGEADDLYVFVHPMSGSTKSERSKVQQQ